MYIATASKHNARSPGVINSRLTQTALATGALAVDDAEFRTAVVVVSENCVISLVCVERRLMGGFMEMRLADRVARTKIRLNLFKRY